MKRIVGIFVAIMLIIGNTSGQIAPDDSCPFGESCCDCVKENMMNVYTFCIKITDKPVMCKNFVMNHKKEIAKAFCAEECKPIKQTGANEIPEFPTVAVPALLASLGYLAVRLRKR